MRNRRRRDAVVSNLGIAMLPLQDFWHRSARAVVQMSFNDVAFAGLLHRRCSLGSVGSEVGRYEVAWKRGSEALKIAFMVKRNPRVLTTRDSSLGAD